MYNSLLDTFLCVADCGSFTKASERLYISSTSVMNQINALENHLEIKLFKRTPRGIILTEAGKSVYGDAKQMIAFSREAVKRAHRLAKEDQFTIRVGTSLLFPCRALINLWYLVSAKYPHFKLKIVPYEDNNNQEPSITQMLGGKIDFMVGPCGSARWLSQFNFFQLGTFKICCAVPRSHPLASKSILEPEDFLGERLMLVKEGDSEVIDRIRSYLLTNYTGVQLIDTPFYYDAEVFNRCEQEGNLLLSLEEWADVHPLLNTLPVSWDYRMPYGLIYAGNPPQGVLQFVEAVKEVV